jgi:hypothetical protein
MVSLNTQHNLPLEKKISSVTLGSGVGISGVPVASLIFGIILKTWLGAGFQINTEYNYILPMKKNIIGFY